MFQNMNFRGDAKDYQDLLRNMATEEGWAMLKLLQILSICYLKVLLKILILIISIIRSFGIAQYTSFSCSRARLSSSRRCRKSMVC